MTIEKCKDFEKDGYGTWDDSSKPTTFANMYDFMKNQNNVVMALSSGLWQPSTAYTAGQVVHSPSLPAGCKATCTTEGTSGSTEPNWTAYGTTVTDGTVKWAVETDVQGTMDGEREKAVDDMHTTITGEMQTAITNAINSAVDNSATEADTKISTAHNYIKRNTAYKVGDILESPNVPHGYLIVVTQAGTTGSSEPDWTTIKNSLGGIVSDGTVQFYINDTLSKHALGDIVYKPVTKTGEHEYLLPLDGQVLDTTKYKRLVDYLGFSTLPNLNGRYLRADTTPNTMVNAGLPNITGTSIFQVWSATQTGAFSKTYVNAKEPQYDNANTNSTQINFDASKSNPIYGNSDTVTPLTYTVRVYICYA